MIIDLLHTNIVYKWILLMTRRADGLTSLKSNHSAADDCPKKAPEKFGRF